MSTRNAGHISIMAQIKYDHDDLAMRFSMHLKETRLANDLTQVQMRERLGFKSLYQYQRLEDYRKSNPKLSTLEKLSKALPEIKLRVFFTQWQKDRGLFST